MREGRGYTGRAVGVRQRELRSFRKKSQHIVESSGSEKEEEGRREVERISRSFLSACNDDHWDIHPK